MIFVIDAGNTNITLGLSDNNNWRQIWRLVTVPEESSKYFEKQIRNLFSTLIENPEQVSQVVLSSVVPGLVAALSEAVFKIFGFKPLVINHKVYKGIELKIDKPHEIGTDLVANAIASAKYGKNCIVVDFGTALTFTTVTNKHILGVSILPGLKTAINALSNNTAQLPEVPLVLPSSVIGKNTVHAIQSGILFGYTGLVKFMIQSIKDELKLPFITIATGGLSSILSSLKDDFDFINPELTLEGLLILGKKSD